MESILQIIRVASEKGAYEARALMRELFPEGQERPTWEDMQEAWLRWTKFNPAFREEPLDNYMLGRTIECLLEHHPEDLQSEASSEGEGEEEEEDLLEEDSRGNLRGFIASSSSEEESSFTSSSPPPLKKTKSQEECF